MKKRSKHVGIDRYIRGIVLIFCIIYYYYLLFFSFHLCALCGVLPCKCCIKDNFDLFGGKVLQNGKKIRCWWSEITKEESGTTISKWFFWLRKWWGDKPANSKRLQTLSWSCGRKLYLYERFNQVYETCIIATVPFESCKKENYDFEFQKVMEFWLRLEQVCLEIIVPNIFFKFSIQRENPLFRHSHVPANAVHWNGVTYLRSYSDSQNWFSFLQLQMPRV